VSEISALPLLLTDVGLWIGLLLTLALFSMLLGDNALARLAQHIVLGAGLGYAAVMTIRYVIGLRLFAPLAQGQWITQLLPLLLALLLVAAALERMAAQSSAGSTTAVTSSARRALQTAGVIPLALLLGTGVAAGLIGIVQGTIFPQVSLVVFATFRNGRTGSALWGGLLTLLLTTATLLALTVGRSAGGSARTNALPRPLQSLLHGWAWLGERVLWIATGLILARLFASRLTLLVDRLDYLVVTLQATGLWQWFVTIGQNIIG
jgi:hypothetical protein